MFLHNMKARASQKKERQVIASRAMIESQICYEPEALRLGDSAHRKMGREATALG